MQTFPQAIFFDFDGIIVESGDIKTEAFLELFRDRPDLLPIVKEHHLNNMGVSRFKKFEWIYTNLLQQTITASKLDELGNRFSDIVLKKVLEAPFVPGALELLRQVYEHCFCFVASGTPQDELLQIVYERSLNSYFREVCGTPRTKAEIVNDLVDKYQLLRSRCWFIGDAQADYQAARAGRLNFIGRYTPDLREFWDQHPELHQVQDLKELLNYTWSHENS